jgi:hypothetical protein
VPVALLNCPVPPTIDNSPFIFLVIIPMTWSVEPEYLPHMHKYCQERSTRIIVEFTDSRVRNILGGNQPLRVNYGNFNLSHTMLIQKKTYGRWEGLVSTWYFPTGYRYMHCCFRKCYCSWHL